MENLFCHSGMVLGSLATLGFVVASVGGLGVLVASALRRTTRQASNS
jgi:hypothetical protein